MGVLAAAVLFAGIVGLAGWLWGWGPARAIWRGGSYPLPVRLSAPIPRPGEAPAASQPNGFFDAALFLKGEAEYRKSGAPRAEPPGAGRLAGGVVPHHNLAGVMFSAFFAELAANPPEVVIVVGPNHQHTGQRIVTGRRAWSTDFGPVAADQPLIDRLVRAGLAVVDDEALEAEHSIGALMPYLKYHAPQTRSVPIVLHRTVTKAEAETLAEFLAPLLGPKTFLVASVDFSHYLTRDEAEVKDEVTLRAIRSFDLPTLWQMGPDHLDSPPSLGVLMLAMRRTGAVGPELAGHTNSGWIIGSDRMETTSYFTFRYRRR